jgi:Zn-dependent protease
MQSSIKRPLLIRIVCILGFIWIVFSFPSVFSPSIKKMGDWYPALFGLIVASSFISYIGVWHMKRWGVQLFIITFFIKEILLVMVEDISYVGIAFSLFFLISMLLYYKRMDLNL